jgi:osmotically-inducible protein OsmY
LQVSPFGTLLAPVFSAACPPAGSIDGLGRRSLVKAQLLALACLLPVFVAVPAAGQTDDGRLAVALRQSIDTYARYTVFDHVQAAADSGVVTLTGKVTRAEKRQEIGARVEALEGVRLVRNEIEVLPSSAGDDLLRKKIARSIYSSSAFWRHAAQPNPPIRIIVAHGHVTLTGAVGNEGERAVAESLATGLGARSVTNTLRTERTQHERQ